MKKILKRVFVIVFAATLFAMPVSIAYASTESTPVLIGDSYGSREYSYYYQGQPEPLDLLTGQIVYLLDFANTQSPIWQVPAGKEFWFVSYMSNVGSSVRVQIFKPGTGFIVDEVRTDYLFYTFPPEQQDSQYYVFVTAITDSRIPGYYAIIF
jgi:hypothetical protein